MYTYCSRYPFPAGAAPIFNTAIESNHIHPELKRKAASAITFRKKKLISIVEAGIRSKEFNKNANPEQIALTIIALIEGGIMISRITEKPTYRTAIMKSLAEFIEQVK